MAHARMVLSLALASLVLLPSSESAQQGDITTIDCPGAAITVVGVNNAGRGVGFYCHDTATCFPFGLHGFIWDGSGCEPIPGLPDPAAPVGMNDAGQVIGIGIDVDESRGFGFLYRRGQVIDQLWCPTALKPCVPFPRGINNRGQIVGYYDKGGPDRPFMWEDGSYVALAELPWDHSTVRANGINPRGDVVGEWHLEEGGITRGYLWPKDGAPVSFGFPIEGNTQSVAKTTIPSAITPGGDMVGYFYESMPEGDPSLDGMLFGPCRGFFRDSDGAMTELKVPGATYTCPLGINAAGKVSGAYTMDAATTPWAGISWHGFVAKVEALIVR